eukprot:TRINITY_DN2625_c0_g1_i1.p1 TRINITY_DN2625_c0_g1~~TRINITY_DN2625_c0_g1_i1.p1  ORF type:complete len:352 (+),score=74.52 TRINITY_DN2625_c0_g1_i1:56-1111(+)
MKSESSSSGSTRATLMATQMPETDLEGKQEDEVTFMERHWLQLRVFFSMIRIKEVEDELTDKYVDMLGPRGEATALGEELPMPEDYVEQECLLPRWEYNESGNDLWHMDPARYLENPVDLMDDTLPKMPHSTDKYTISTFYFLKARLAGEKIDSAEKCVFLFIIGILQLALLSVIVVLGSFELDGGRIEVVVGSYCLGVVGIISQICIIMGVLALNENFLRKYWIASLWMLSMQVTYLYTEIHHAFDNRRVCEPSKNNFSTTYTRSCANEEGATIAALALNSFSLGLTFLAVYNVVGLLDSINDESSIADNLHVAKYFQVYTSELSAALICSSETSSKRPAQITASFVKRH